MASLSTLSLDELTTLYDTQLRKLNDALAPRPGQSPQDQNLSGTTSQSERQSKLADKRKDSGGKQALLSTERCMWRNAI